MSSFEWVIDTWVLATASDALESRSHQALQFLFTVFDGHRVALDNLPDSSTIVQEYYRYIWPRQPTYVSEWWKRIVGSATKMAWYSGQLPRAYTEHLINRLRFDRSDLKFVGVAYRCPDHLLVSEDSDYNTEVKQYLGSDMRITVLDLADALQKARV